MAVTIKKCKFKATNTRHVEMNRVAKRPKYKSQKLITSAKKKNLVMLCKKGLFLSSIVPSLIHRQ